MQFEIDDEADETETTSAVSPGSSCCVGIDRGRGGGLPCR